MSAACCGEKTDLERKEIGKSNRMLHTNQPDCHTQSMGRPADYVCGQEGQTNSARAHIRGKYCGQERMAMKNNPYNPYNRRCIDGHITGIGNCVGYCLYEGHPGYLTKSLRKEHDCIKKNCYHYEPKVRTTEPVTAGPFAVLMTFAIGG